MQLQECLGIIHYFGGEALYAFGYGLSYTSFEYKSSKPKASSYLTNDTITLSITVSNTGKYDGDEVVQVYTKQPEELKNQAIKSLVAFQRVHFIKGETKEVNIQIPVSRLRHFDLNINNYSVAKGNFELLIGSASDDIRLKEMLTIK